MTPDELKSLPKGTFVVMKTGFYPMKVKLKLFFKWGIAFEESYEAIENGNRKVEYANKFEIINGIIETYNTELSIELPQEESNTPSDKSSNSEIRTSPKSNETQDEQKSPRTQLRIEVKHNEKS